MGADATADPFATPVTRHPFRNTRRAQFRKASAKEGWTTVKYDAISINEVDPSRTDAEAGAPRNFGTRRKSPLRDGGSPPAGATGPSSCGSPSAGDGELAASMKTNVRDGFVEKTKGGELFHPISWVEIEPVRRAGRRAGASQAAHALGGRETGGHHAPRTKHVCDIQG